MEPDAWVRIAGLPYIYRICPTNKTVIERKAEVEGARWCFFKVCASPNESKRSLAVLQGKVIDDKEEEPWEEDGDTLQKE